jgi:hypothetical protein
MIPRLGHIAMSCDMKAVIREVKVIILMRFLKPQDYYRKASVEL